MPENSNHISSDLQAANKLTIDAITGITDIVESLHYKILTFGGILGSSETNRTKGITGMVYSIIRGITKLAGNGIDVFLNKLSFLLNEKNSSNGREAIISALNGVLGDYLVSTKNTLAIPMQICRNGKSINEKEISEAVKKSGNKLVIMIHGICMNDIQWNRKGHNHGEALTKDLGIVPVYLRYNSGLHISENGKEFSGLLEKIINELPQSTELIIIAHSMGGLVSRSACYYGKMAKHEWLNNLKKIIFLGTPHHGAPLEKGGNWIDNILEISSYSAPFSRLGKIRSSGVTDLRYGNITDYDWKGRNRFKSSGDLRIPVPLPENVQCTALAANAGKESTILGNTIIGDGLVPVNSALGLHKNADFNLSFSEKDKHIFHNLKHLDLLNNKEVYEKIKEKLANKLTDFE